ncbi:restriction endonuclease [Chryseomicrobium excrementi]|uniref:Restriction endonuclease n=1 Tax=Chryseomicrobium excrementi TaxID=2041346 RepID=A0A2M9EY98_9BACL|nr:DUF3427 domain-containing protein [Chryseomicrobium excrementi]PJK16185.1 restriction endonuclease [Chryseomicrobium excrementi]
MKFDFKIGEMYSRKEVKKLIGHPEPDLIGGIWGTGYTSFENCYFIFANVGAAGRTGHDYPNLLAYNSLYWYSKGTESLHTKTITNMMSGNYDIYIFTREDSKDVQFVFRGLGYVKDFEDNKPVHIVWGFHNSKETIVPKGFQINQRKLFLEGAKKDSLATRYERNPGARNACLAYYGYNCVCCNFNFENKYGEVGKEFIHVHHEIEISTIGEEYQIDPIMDLKPVCPNCHAMIHKRKPAYSIYEIKKFLEKV